MLWNITTKLSRYVYNLSTSKVSIVKILKSYLITINDTKEVLENLKGNYDEERIGSMALSIDIKKEIENKLYLTYEDRFLWKAFYWQN